jgi:hypothetical protein
MTDIKLFESKKVHSHWDDESEKWYFSVIDVVEILTDSANQLYDKIVQLKMKSSDNRMRITDCTDTEGLLRIIQSIPSSRD